MNSLNIPRDVDALRHLNHFLDLFETEVSSEQLKESVQALRKIKDGTTLPHRLLRQVYEECVSFLEDSAAASGFDGELLKIQRGLYSELEYLYSLDGEDRRHCFFVVIPVADRPVLLGKCVDSLIRQCEDFGYGGKEKGSEGTETFRRIRLFILDDSKEDIHRRSIREIASSARRHGIRTGYFGIEEQADLVEKVRTMEGDRASSIIGTKEPTAPHKGASIIRNLSYLYLLSLIRDLPERERVLIYFLDSDEEFAVAVRRHDGPGEEIGFINYFYWLDRIFRASGVKVLTGKVVGDPPVSPSVMVNTFLDDLGLFLRAVSRTGPQEPCPFHETTKSGEFSAEYHDMVELFGYSQAEALRHYNCSLAGDHTVKDCFADFSGKALDFFHGLHPTRLQYYQHLGGFTKTEAARTVYTGNYVITPDALEHFIPFAGLNLRMAGPTLGRILKSGISKEFVSANLPLLHRRTTGEGRQEFRSGVRSERGRVDLSGEFIRQFWGDVMLFSVEELTSRGFPEKTPSPAEVDKVLEGVQDRLWAIYRTQKAAAAEKVRTIKKYLSEEISWWNDSPETSEAIMNFQDFCSSVEENFGENSEALRNIAAMINEGSYRRTLSAAICAFEGDRSTWQRLLQSVGAEGDASSG